MKLNKLHNYLFPLYFSLACYILVRLITDTFSGESHLMNVDALTIIVEITTCIVAAYLISWVWRILSKKAYRMNDPNITRKLIFKNLAVFVGITALLVNVTIIPMVALTDDGLSYADFNLINSLTILITVIWYFYYHTNYFMTAFARRENDLLNLEKQKTENELAYLKSQIHPHFLFNALNTIYFQIDEKNNQAKETIEQLSEILRYGLYEPSTQKVLISKELTFLEKYIGIMKTRMGDHVIIHFDKEIMEESLIAPQLFFPLVENAFKYVSEKAGEINIRVKTDKEKIIFEVRNTYSRKKKTKPGGVGLQNLKRRLELLYPDLSELSLNKNEKEFTAKLKITTP